MKSAAATPGNQADGLSLSEPCRRAKPLLESRPLSADTLATVETVAAKDSPAGARVAAMPFGAGGANLSSLTVRIAMGETTGILRSQISGLRLLGNTPRKKESTDRATPGPKAGALISDTTLVAPCASKASLVAKADCISAALDGLKSRNGGRANVARTREVCIQPFSRAGARMPTDQGDQRCQAVAGNSEGEVPTTAPACAMKSREGIRPPGSDDGERVWLNPPYGRTIGNWMRKAFEESQRGALVVCLVPARPDTRWWHDYAARGVIRFVRGRLKFGGSRNSAPFPSALVLFADPLGGGGVEPQWDVHGSRTPGAATRPGATPQRVGPPALGPASASGAGSADRGLTQ